MTLSRQFATEQECPPKRYGGTGLITASACTLSLATASLLHRAAASSTRLINGNTVLSLQMIDVLPNLEATNGPFSTNLVVILIYAHILAVATLHQSRSKDKYQNAVASLCILGSIAVTAWASRGGMWKTAMVHLLGLIPVVTAVGLSLSAVAHLGRDMWTSRTAGTVTGNVQSIEKATLKEPAGSQGCP